MEQEMKAAAQQQQRDHPFDQCVADASFLCADGHWVFQKFTCSHCGNRLTMEKPNIFYTHGTCDKCHQLTDIRAAGCNYLLWAGKNKEELASALGFSLPDRPGLTVADCAAAVSKDEAAK
jgi:hypothetical protein